MHTRKTTRQEGMHRASETGNACRQGARPRARVGRRVRRCDPSVYEGRSLTRRIQAKNTQTDLTRRIRRLRGTASLERATGGHMRDNSISSPASHKARPRHASTVAKSWLVVSPSALLHCPASRLSRALSPPLSPEPKRGGVLKAAFSADPAGFDPVRGPSGMSHVVIEQVYSTLDGAGSRRQALPRTCRELRSQRRRAPIYFQTSAGCDLSTTGMN